jgi:hypothetical protein
MTLIRWVQSFFLLEEKSSYHFFLSDVLNRIELHFGKQ